MIYSNKWNRINLEQTFIHSLSSILFYKYISVLTYAHTIWIIRKHEETRIKAEKILN